MGTTKKTAGKTAKRDVRNLSTLLSYFEESTAKWKQEGDVLKFSKEELNLIVECKAKCYSGTYGDFVKLYVSIMLDDKKLVIKGDEDNDGKRRAGIKLDVTSTKMVALEDGDEIDIDPSKCIFYNIVNVEDGEVRRRVRVLK